MTDQIPADLADKVRKLAARFRQQMEPHVSVAECVVWERAAEAVDALLPAPPLPTLADMTMDERYACRWMQCDVRNAKITHGVIANNHGGNTHVLDAEGEVWYLPPTDITPRPDLPRLEWPAGDQKPAPVPALPDGWRLADHQRHGRVIVTKTTPNRDGRVYYVLPSADPLGFDWLFCTPAELTYIDVGQEGDQ